MSASNRFFFVGATILLISLGASASEVTVPGGSIDQIAEAVAEAGPGGRVTLGAGNHVITKTVVVDVNGVTIRGASGSKILGRGNVAGERLVLFEIRANDVAMKDLDVAAAVQSVGDLALVVVFSGQRLSVTDCEAVDLVQLVDGRDAAALMALRNRVTTAIPTEVDPPASHLVVIRTSGIGEVLIEANRLTGPRTADTVGIEILPPALGWD